MRHAHGGARRRPRLPLRSEEEGSEVFDYLRQLERELFAGQKPG